MPESYALKLLFNFGILLLEFRFSTERTGNSSAEPNIHIPLLGPYPGISVIENQSQKCTDVSWRRTSNCRICVRNTKSTPSTPHINPSHLSSTANAWSPKLSPLTAWKIVPINVNARRERNSEISGQATVACQCTIHNLGCAVTLFPIMPLDGTVCGEEKSELLAFKIDQRGVTSTLNQMNIQMNIRIYCD